MDTASIDLCRVSLVAANQRLDVALPFDLPMATLLPGLLMQVNENGPNGVAEAAGWILQDAKGRSLGTDLTARDLALCDGDLLFLRPVEYRAPTAVYDDAADAIAGTLDDVSPRWTGDTTRIAGSAVSAGLLLAGAAAVIRGGAASVNVLVVALVVTVGLVGALAALVRRGAGIGTCTIVGVAATGYALTLGWTASPRLVSIALGTATEPSLALRGVCAGTAAVVTAALVIAVAGRAWAAFGSCVLLALGGGLSCLVAVGAGASGGGALAMVLAVGLPPFSARIAYVLAGLPRPAVPLGVSELRAHGEPLATAQIISRVTDADRLLTGLLVSSAMFAAVDAGVLVVAGGGDAVALALVGSASVFSRARFFAGLTHRAVLLGGGVAGLVLTAVGTVRSEGWSLTVLVAAVASAACALAVALRGALRVPPAWARMGDLLDVLVTCSVMLLALQVSGVFTALREWRS